MEKATQVSRTGTPGRAYASAGLCFALVVYPFAYALAKKGTQALFSFVQGDAYLYLAIAERSGWHGFTIDGSHPTNGFHPLWQFILTALFHDPAVHGTAGPILVTGLLATAAVATGAALCSLAIFRFTRSALLSMLPVPGVYFMTVGALFNNHPIWENLGGMEAGLSVFFGGLLLLVFAAHLTQPGRQDVSLESLVDERGRRSLFVKMGLVLPWLVLARLDDVFLPVALFGVVMLARRPLGDRVAAGVRLVGPSAALVVSYMIYSKAMAGTFMPISGSTKGGFVLPLGVYMTLATLFPPLMDLKNAVSAKQTDVASVVDNAFRTMQLVVPALFAAWFLVYARHAARGVRPAARTWILCAFAAYVILKSGYNLANVHLWHQGHWYFGLHMLLVSFVGALLLLPLYQRLAVDRFAVLSLTGLYVLYVVLAAGRTANARANNAFKVEHQLWVDRDAIAAAIEAHASAPKLIAFDDGITSYALPFSTLHGFAFAADVETAKALREGRLLRLAYARGHKVLTSADYMPMETPVRDSDGLRAFLKASFLEDRVKDELDRFDYRLVHWVPTSHAPFIEFSPRPGL